MTGLSSLRIDNVRNLSGISLEGFAGVNILYGSNGAGKTSVLEAIHYLGTGRSFRSRVHKKGHASMPFSPSISYAISAINQKLIRSQHSH